MKKPFRITGFTYEKIDAVVVRIAEGGVEGAGEASGVIYLNDTPEKMQGQIERVRPLIEDGLSRRDLQKVLPAGGARNALDCALWDLDAQLTGQPVWKKVGVELAPVRTVFTIGATSPEETGKSAREMTLAKAIKLKLTGEDTDAARVRAARAARPDAWIGVDANQAYSRRQLEEMMPTLLEANIALIEQPTPIGKERELEGFEATIPLAADESVQSASDIAPMKGLFQYINIKLDKCGGLTEALDMVVEARRLGFKLMVGNMMGTTLATAPAFVLGQLVDLADLDGPFLLASDRDPSLFYENGVAYLPPNVWGARR